jgi:ESCRT-I complex subunit VPS28
MILRSYAPACIKLLAQYKSLLKLVQDQLDRPHKLSNGTITVGLEGFMQRYRMDCPAALHRLVVGVPATVEHSAEAGNGDAGEMGKWVAETTQVSSGVVFPLI